MVTNSLNILPEVDRILMIENGTIVECGTYDNLKNLNGKFASFIKTYLENHEQTKENLSKLNYFIINLFLLFNSFINFYYLESLDNEENNDNKYDNKNEKEKIDEV